MILGERAVDADHASGPVGRAGAPADGVVPAEQAGEQAGEQADGGVSASDVTASVRVRTTGAGLPSYVGIDPSLLVPGGERFLAERVLAVCRMASTAALARRRRSFAAAGIDEGLLAQVGLPGRDGLAAADRAATAGATEGEPHSWLARA